MIILKLLLTAFLLPGTFVLKRLGVSIKDDGGVMRSFINMCFWGAFFLWIALKFYAD